MKATELIKAADPISKADIARWQQDQQHHVWGQILERRDQPFPLTAQGPPRPKRHLQAFAVAAGLVVVAALAVMLLTGPQTGQTVTSAAAVRSLPGPELSSAGSIWVSGPTLSVTVAASEFVEVTFGWSSPDIEPETRQPGPTWVNVTNNNETIRMLLAPETLDTVRWQLLQVGTDPDMTRVSISPSTTGVTLGVIPETAHTVTLVADTPTGTTKITLTQPTVDSSIEIEGQARSILALYFNAAGELIDARGSHR